MTMLRDLIPQEEINADLELLNDDSYYYGETVSYTNMKLPTNR